MLDQRITELINAGIDGELGPQEQKELEAVLASSPEAVAFRLELLELNNAFRNMLEMDPPPALARNILQQVQLPVRQKPFNFLGFMAGFNPVAGGLAFAAGLLLTVGFYETGSRRVTQQDTINMVGTMVASDPVRVPGQGDRLLLDLDGLSGAISLNVHENGQVLEIDLDSDQVIEIEIGLGQAGLAVTGFAQDGHGEGSYIDTLEFAGGTMRAVSQGRHRFVVFLEQAPGLNHRGEGIRIGIFRDGERVYEDSLGARR